MWDVANHFARWFVGLAGPETQTTVAERDCLCRHAAGCRRVVEIGVWHGVTTCRLRGQMAADGILYAVDPSRLKVYKAVFEPKVTQDASELGVGVVFVS